jgi:hypothetical protein
MATTYYPRSAWTNHARPTGGLVPLAASAVKGVAVHYTGDPRLGQTATLAQTCARLEGERRFHTDAPPQGRGWTDIAYGIAIDQGGRVFDCRGAFYRSAANGSVSTNSAYGAVTFLLGVADTPTPAMVEAFRDWRTAFWLDKFPKATAVVGHRDLYSTSCPGDPAYRLIKNGTLGQDPTGEDDDMPLSKDDAALLITELATSKTFRQAIATAVWQAGWPLTANPDGPQEAAQIRLWRASHPEYAADVVADAVLAKLATSGATPGGPSIGALKQAIRDVLTEGTGGTP